MFYVLHFGIGLISSVSGSAFSSYMFYKYSSNTANNLLMVLILVNVMIMSELWQNYRFLAFEGTQSAHLIRPEAKRHLHKK